MTQRKPAGASWESWIERQIQDAQERGEFDELSGHGQPLESVTGVHDEMWWLKAKLRDEDIEYLPPTIAIKAERANAIAAAMTDPTEAAARARIEDVNERIRNVNRYSAAGPPSSVVVIDTDVLIERWRAAHPVPEPSVGDEPGPEPTPRPRAWVRWWRLLRGKRPERATTPETSSAPQDRA